MRLGHFQGLVGSTAGLRGLPSRGAPRGERMPRPARFTPLQATVYMGLLLTTSEDAGHGQPQSLPGGRCGPTNLHSSALARRHPRDPVLLVRSASNAHPDPSRRLVRLRGIVPGGRTKRNNRGEWWRCRVPRAETVWTASRLRIACWRAMNDLLSGPGRGTRRTTIGEPTRRDGADCPGDFGAVSRLGAGDPVGCAECDEAIGTRSGPRKDQLPAFCGKLEALKDGLLFPVLPPLSDSRRQSPAPACA